MLSETKYINLSLTYLEQVIVALKEKQDNKRVHIPYRNSLMTTVLKDSLGGNCKTVLISNLSTDLENIDETVSTCRFAQRCAQLENIIKKNEIVDVDAEMRRLTKENKKLNEELEFMRNQLSQIQKNGGKNINFVNNSNNNNEMEEDSENRQIFDKNQNSQNVNNKNFDLDKDKQNYEGIEITPALIKSIKPKIEDY